MPPDASFHNLDLSSPDTSTVYAPHNRMTYTATSTVPEVEISPPSKRWSKWTRAWGPPDSATSRQPSHNIGTTSDTRCDRQAWDSGATVLSGTNDAIPLPYLPVSNGGRLTEPRIATRAPTGQKESGMTWKGAVKALGKGCAACLDCASQIGGDD
jgi:hypothetical protein